jgi:hypothetical protein
MEVLCPNCHSNEHVSYNWGKLICLKCGYENELGLNFRLEYIEEIKDIPEHCPICGKRRNGKKATFEEHDRMFFRCSQCKSWAGYEFFDYSSDDSWDPFLESFDTLSEKIAEQEGRYVLSATKMRKIEQELRKEERKKKTDLVEKRKRQLRTLVRIKTPELEMLGISPDAITASREKVHSLLKDGASITNKQLHNVFPAALYFTYELEPNLFTKRRITERQLENIFNTTRKTIRRWKKLFQEREASSKKEEQRQIRTIAFRWEGEEAKFRFVDLPEEVKALTQNTENKYVECDFCQNISKQPCWRLDFNDRSWSFICKSCREGLSEYLIMP